MPRITFFTRPTKKQSKNPVSIYLRFTDGRNIDITTKSGIDVLVERFSNKTHELRQRSDYKDREIDERKLHDLKERVFSEYKQLRNNPTKEWLTSVIDRFHFPDKYNEKKNCFHLLKISSSKLLIE